MTHFLDVDWTQLPCPENDGAAAHLEGNLVPSVRLSATNGSVVDLAMLLGRTVVYAYPMTGQPNVPLPEGWDQIPGARGCTPQSCAFRDHFTELLRAGADHVFGLSTQTAAYQAEVVQRLHLPFALLSDAEYCLTDALTLPWFEVLGRRLLKRFTLILNNGRIEKVFYPVFPPDQNASAVLEWLKNVNALPNSQSPCLGVGLIRGA
jgi:peroxiredoxin